jgi:hypothetical protein
MNNSPETEDLARDVMSFQAKVDAMGEQIEMLAKIFGPPPEKPDIFSVNYKPTNNREEENATTED